MTDAELTQMPVAGLDDMDRAMLERELRGAVYGATQALRRAEKGGHVETIRLARERLAMCYRRARAEKVRPYARGPVVQGEHFAPGYTREAAEYERSTR